MNEQPLDIARGDIQVDQLLRASLRTLRDRSGDRMLRSLLDDVLTGRRSLREIAGTDAFGTAVTAGVAATARQWAERTPEEREQAAAQGRAVLRG